MTHINIFSTFKRSLLLTLFLLLVGIFFSIPAFAQNHYITSGGSYNIGTDQINGQSVSASDRIWIKTDDAVTLSGFVDDGDGNPASIEIYTDFEIVNLTIVDLKIDCTENIDNDSHAFPIHIHPWSVDSSTVNLTIIGDNYLKGAREASAIFTGGYCILNIDAHSTDHTLEAVGGTYGAGIGGAKNYGDPQGSVVINGGTVIARAGNGSNSAAGIGSGYDAYRGFGNLTINGGNVTAYGGGGSSAIGPSGSASNGAITITGGNVTAINTDSYHPAICSDTVDISGGTVIADGQGEIGISGGNVNISGGKIYATGTTGYSEVYSAGYYKISEMDNSSAIFTGNDIEHVDYGDGYYIRGQQEFFTENTKVETVASKLGLSGEPWDSAEAVYYQGYTVEYDNNEASGTQTDTNSPYLKNEQVTILNQGTMTNGTNSFNGWNTADDGTGTDYSVGQKFNISDDYNLFAQWIAARTVTATAGTGGSVSPTSQTVINGANSSPIMASASAGYHFTGWSGDASGTTNPISISNVTSDKNITANFTANNYTVVFNGNTNDGGSTANQAFTYGAVQDLTANGFTKTGYAFAGWATSSGGAVAYDDKQSVNNLTTVNNGTFNLYAKWAQSRTLTYDGNGNTGDTMPTEQRGEGLTVTLTPNTSTKIGYYFSGWNTEEDGSGTPYADGASFTMPTEDTELFAQWTPNSYTVKFNENKGTGSTDISGTMADQSFVYDTAQDLTNNTYSRTGYDFVGWSTTADGTALYTDAENVSNLTTEKNGVFNLYAVWTAKDYVVTFEGNTNSSGIMVNQTIVFDQSESLAKNTYEKIGHTFAGWNTQVGGGGTAYADESSFTMDVEGDTLFAQWTAIDYTVTYHANEGSDPPTDANQYNYDDVVTVIAKDSMKKAGYSFVCWNTSADGTGTDYNPDNADAFNMPANDVTLYAKWSADDQNITYDNNGGTGSASDVQPTGTIFKLHSGSDFTRDDYIIDGWTIEGTDYLLGALYQMTTHDVTAEAIWKDDSDNDGVSDEDEIASGTDPNDSDDKMNTGKISITVLKGDGTPAAGCTLRLNSEPIETITDEEGKAMFGSVTLSPHILTLIDGTEVLGTYALDFTRNSSNETGIIDDASTDSDGSILTAVASNFLTLDMIIQQNGTNNWQLMLVEYMERLSNPKTGENVWD